MGDFLILVLSLQLSHNHYKWYLCRSLGEIPDNCSLDIPKRMQWYHLVHSPSHSRASSFLRTISWQTPHLDLLILDALVAPAAFQNFIQVTLVSLHYIFKPGISLKLIQIEFIENKLIENHWNKHIPCVYNKWRDGTRMHHSQEKTGRKDSWKTQGAICLCYDMHKDYSTRIPTQMKGCLVSTSRTSQTLTSV